MRNSFKGIVAAAALAATGIVATPPAEARDHTGAAVAAGIIGLGLGAAIASSDRPHYSEVAYDGGGYPGYGYGYGYGPGYYAQPYAYGGGYYRDDGRGWRRHRYDRWQRDHRDFDRRDRDRRDWRGDRWGR